jgi:hypothetical protein
VIHATKEQREARATEIDALVLALDPSNFGSAPLISVLASAITFSTCDWPGVEVLEQCASELSGLVALVRACPRGAELLDVADLFPLLEGLEKRIRVALELIARSRARGFTMPEQEEAEADDGR